MVGSESNELRQQQQYLSVGSEVEVSSDEDGFKGAWFRATIVESPISSSASKKRKKALVEYKNLVTDDGSKQLREHIDSSYVRPLPPDVNDCGFQEGDVVDADYKDGWWTGIIRKVLEKSKYRVFFDNPPDVIEFELSHLRLHQDWVGGKWVRPQRLVCNRGGDLSGLCPFYHHFLLSLFCCMLCLGLLIFCASVSDFPQLMIIFCGLFIYFLVHRHVNLIGYSGFR